MMVQQAGYFTSVAHLLQDSGTIPKLLPFLGRTNPVALQAEALHALYNLCKISRTRQEAAAVAGVVPRLIALVSSAPSKVGGVVPWTFPCRLAHSVCSATVQAP